jgi:hypothetical protein
MKSVRDTILQFFHTFLVGTVSTAEILATTFHAMADDAHSTVNADRCEVMNGALKTIKDEGLPIHDDFKRFIVLISTNFTFRHTFLLLVDVLRIY